MLDIALLPGEYAVCRMGAGATLPYALSSGLRGADVVTVSWTSDGISVICPIDRAPAQAVVETTWRCLRVTAPVTLAGTAAWPRSSTRSPRPGSAPSRSPRSTPTICWCRPSG